LGIETWTAAANLADSAVSPARQRDLPSKRRAMEVVP
jgi:hypothetical protein